VTLRSPVIDGHILSIKLDAKEIYPDDPGQGTPAMVTLYSRTNRELDCGTFHCALCEGELSHNGTVLSEAQVAWLDQHTERVDAFIENGG
jgi:hypothetical protein